MKGGKLVSGSRRKLVLTGARKAAGQMGLSWPLELEQLAVF